MTVTENKFFEEGDTIDHEYGNNEIKEERIDGESEVEEGSDDSGDEEGADVEKEDKQSQDVPEDKYKSF